jgi:hypothetical protein
MRKVNICALFCIKNIPCVLYIQLGAIAVGAGTFGAGAEWRDISASSYTKLMWLHGAQAPQHLNKYYHRTALIRYENMLLKLQ